MYIILYIYVYINYILTIFGDNRPLLPYLTMMVTSALPEFEDCHESVAPRISKVV